jgi:hypothetical protein
MSRHQRWRGAITACDADTPTAGAQSQRYMTDPWTPRRVDDVIR